jgi:hypothetical protein
MTMKMSRGKTTLSETERNEFGAIIGTSKAEDRRKERRERLSGDVLWSHATGKNENRFKGTIIDESGSGLCILTLTPLNAGSIVRIYSDDRRPFTDATVIWCKRVSADIYKSGLLLG